jgi:RNA-binding protein
MTLSKKQKIYLKSLAHDLQPLVFVGKNGVTETFMTSLAKTLDDHELIKMKFQSFKEDKNELTEIIVDEIGAELIGRVGNIAILYRQNKDPEKRKIHFPTNIK